MISLRGVWVFLILAGCLVQPSPARAQLSLEEQNALTKLLLEKDDHDAIARRLHLIDGALQRMSLPRPPGTYSSSQASLKRSRIPPADALAFLPKYFDHPDEATKRTALRLAGEYGADAQPALAKVRQLVKDPIRGVREDAMLTAATIEPANRDIAAALVERLAAPMVDDSENRAVLKAIILMAPAVDQAAVAKIKPFLEHRWTEVRVHAFEAIGKILDLPRPTMQQLRDMEVIAWHKAPDQGYAVLAAIQQSGAKTDFAVPLLAELLISNPPTYIQCVVFDTLAKVKTGNPRMISLLLERLVSPDLVLRERARQASLHFDLLEPASARAMAKGLRHADSKVRFEAVVRLRIAADRGKLTPAGLAEVRPLLLETLKEADETVSVGLLDNYLMLLRYFGRAGAPAAEAMLRLYTSPTYFGKLPAREAAHRRAKQLAVLANIGVPKEGRTFVLETLKQGPRRQDDDGYAYAAAARAVAGFGPEAPEARAAVPWLLPALKGDAKEPEFYFIDWSGKEGFRPTSARLEAIRACAAIGPEAKAALPQLREIAAHKGGPIGSLEAIIPQEARRAVAAIEAK